VIPLTLVSASDCHLCEQAHSVLDRLGSEFPLEVIEVDWESPTGHSLTSSEGVPFPPAVFLGGSLIGYGRISERALRRRLAKAVA
jgi:glutaredoxin